MFAALLAQSARVLVRRKSDLAEGRLSVNCGPGAGGQTTAPRKHQNTSRLPAPNNLSRRWPQAALARTDCRFRFTVPVDVNNCHLPTSVVSVAQR